MDARQAITLAAERGAPTRLVHAWTGMLREGDSAGALAGAREWLHGQNMLGLMSKAARPISGLAATPLTLMSGSPYLTGAVVVAALVAGAYWLDRQRDS